MNYIEHIGIAVKDIKKSNELYASLLGTDPYKMEEVLSEHVMTSFFKTGNNKIELLKPLMSKAPLQNSLKKKEREFITSLLLLMISKAKWIV